MTRPTAYVESDVAYKAVAEVAVRTIMDIADKSEHLDYGQRMKEVEDVLFSFHSAATKLDETYSVLAPTPRRGIRADVRNLIYARDGQACLRCGSTERLTIDHVVPLDVGGRDDMSNYQTLCTPCNSSKGTDAVDYRRGPVADLMEMLLPPLDDD